MPPSIGVAAFVFGMVLILAALVGKDLEIAAVKLPALGKRERIAACVVGVVLVYVGLFNPFPAQQEGTATVPSPTATAAIAAAAATVAPSPTATALPPTSTPAPQNSNAALDALTTEEQLEPLLKAANILLTAGDEKETMTVRGYFDGPGSAYHMLAVAALKTVGDKRFRQPVHLDIVDKWYTKAAGSGYASKGPIDTQMMQNALVQAHNDFYGDHVESLEQLLETRR